MIFNDLMRRGKYNGGFQESEDNGFIHVVLRGVLVLMMAVS